MKRGFGSDNHSGISPEIMQAIAGANVDHALAYGDDEWCKRTEVLFRDYFGPQAKVYFVFNGTGANVLNIDLMCRSHEAVVCAETLDEIRALAGLAHSYNMYLHMDGARLANAAVALGCSFKEMTTDCGVDCLSFGGTKNGMLMGESVVLLNPALDVDAKYRRKQMTQLSSKMRFVAAQFEAYLATGLWKRNAEHSNNMAQLLYQEVSRIEGVRVMYPVHVNSVFAQLPTEVWHSLQQEYFFYDWDEANDVVRWMCSFDTTEQDIRDFANVLRRLMK